MSDLSDRDRVTAILTLADERDALMKNLSPTRTELGKMADADMALMRALRSNGPWLARTLLEALDTIDRLEGENAELRKRRFFVEVNEADEDDFQW